MKSIYRKLKDYIRKENHGTTSIFGTLYDNDCVYVYEDEETKEWKEWSCSGGYNHQKDFLLNYYVVSIFPTYVIKENRIIPKLQINLRKGKEE